MTYLIGKKILLTRPSGQLDCVAEELRSVGAIPLLMPAVCLLSLADEEIMRSLLRAKPPFDWLIFTSANGVRFFFDLFDQAEAAKLLEFTKIAVIGPKTANCLKTLFRPADAMPKEYRSENIIEELGDLRGRKVLLARARQASPILSMMLQAVGATVEDYTLYDILPNLDMNLVDQIRAESAPDFLTFTSAEIFKSSKLILEKAGKDWLNTIPSIAIGPVTAATMQEFGVQPHAVAKEYTMDGILEGLFTT